MITATDDVAPTWSMNATAFSLVPLWKMMALFESLAAAPALMNSEARASTVAWSMEVSAVLRSMSAANEAPVATVSDRAMARALKFMMRMLSMGGRGETSIDQHRVETCRTSQLVATGALVTWRLPVI